MSADEWMDCPKCTKTNCVRIDGMHDFILRIDGRIDNSAMHGKCTKCGAQFEGK